MNKSPARHAVPAALLAATLAALGTLRAAPALAGPTEDARMLFDVGKQAFEKGDFVSALSAFEPAYRLAPRTGILFSIAQAHRKQYFTGGRQVDHLRAAIAAYKEYLGKVEQGGRRSDAAEALVELEAIAARLDPSGTAPAPTGAAPAQITRVAINTQISDAQIVLDAEPPREPPLVTDVKPGKHTVRVTAPGYFDETREIPVAAGQMVPVDIPLREKPSHLTIRARDGASITLDGRLTATTPLSQPLDVPPGHHLVSVTRNGCRAFSQEIDLGRDEARQLDVNLEATVQRSVSYGVMALGIAGIVASGALVGVALYHEQQAQSFQSQQSSGALSCATQTACQALYAGYDNEVQARDSFRTDAGIVGAAGAVVGVVGVMLFAFDQPTLGPAAHRADTPRPAPAPAPRDRSLELSMAPILAPGLYGAALGGRF